MLVDNTEPLQDPEHWQEVMILVEGSGVREVRERRRKREVIRVSYIIRIYEWK